MSENNRRTNLPLQQREAPIVAVDRKNLTADLTWTAGARVQRYDWMRDRPYMEELSLDPKHVRMGRLQSGNAPLLDSHDRWGGIRAVIGVVESAKLDGAASPATVRFSRRDEVAPIVQDVEDKIIRNVSVGYAIYRMEMIPPKSADDAWIYRATDWEPQELSLVAIGADDGATLRAAPQARAGEPLFSCEFITPAGAAADLQPEREQTMTTKTGQQGGAPAAERSSAGTEGTQPAATTTTTEGQQQPAAQPAGERAAPAATAPAAAADSPALAAVIRSAERTGLGAEFVSERLERGETLEQIRNAVINELAARDATSAMQRRADVQIVQDEVLTRRGLVANALMHRHNPKIKLENGAGEWRGYNLRELMREMLTLRGVNTRGMTVSMMWERTLQSGSDLPNILADVANKSLRQAYDAAPRTHVMWTKASTAPDFKNINRTLLSGAPNLLQVLPGEEIKRGPVTDGKETYQLATFARIIGINRQVVINDDLNALTRVPELIGRAAADLEADTVYAIVTANAALADTLALFEAGTHKNLTTGPGTVISVASLGVGRAAMRTQKGVEGRPINVRPSYLVVPVALETLAEQYTSADFVSAKSSDVNVFRQGRPSALTVVAEPRLDAASALSWYLAADPAQIDTIEYAHLEGQEGVYIETRQGFDVDGIEIKGRLDFAAKALDYRGLYKNAGA